MDDVIAIQGSDLLMFYRRKKDEATKPGVLFPLQTEHELSKSKETDSTPTKTGNIRSVNNGDNEISQSAIASRHDAPEIVPLWEDLEEGFDDNEIIEAWQVDRTRMNEDDTYSARYFQGYFTEFTLTAPPDGPAEVEFTYGINGNGAKGDTTLNGEQAEAAQYAFRDLEAVEPEIPGA